MIYTEKQNLKYLNWTKIRRSSGTNGSFLKAYSEFNNHKKYYKLSNYDSFRGVIGHECVNEIVVDRLLSIFGIEHLNYDLIHADVTLDGKYFDTWLCASDDFKKQNESKIALDAYYQLERENNESPLEFCKRNGWSKYIYEMLVVDFLILNRDRHGANIEVLRNPQSKTIRLAPLFDHGLSLLFNCRNQKEIENAELMEDKPIQCFVGGNSAKENLSLIPRGEEPDLAPLKRKDKSMITDGLESVMPRVWIDRVWEMIWKRWKYYESFCNKR